jgi:hypothetical protein
MAPPTMQDFTSTFIISSQPGAGAVLSEVPKALAKDAHRQRRAHQKSRKGCDNCKRRRIKVSSTSHFL